MIRTLPLLALILAASACNRPEANSAAPAANTAASLGTGGATDWQQTASGLRYRRISGAGTGARPLPTDTVTLHYVGTLMDGTEFDSSFRSGAPVTMALPSLIPGWREGVPLMSVGDVYEFEVPPALGYGPEGAGPIPPNATLRFQIGLIGIG